MNLKNTFNRMEGGEGGGQNANVSSKCGRAHNVTLAKLLIPNLLNFGQEMESPFLSLQSKQIWKPTVAINRYIQACCLKTVYF